MLAVYHREGANALELIRRNTYTCFMSESNTHTWGVPLFYRVVPTTLTCYRKWNLLCQVLAVVFTIAIVMTGLDWKYFVVFHGDSIRGFIFPAILLGMFLPFIIPLSFLAAGTILKKARFSNAAWGIAQSALLGLIISSFYKAFTGRIPPRMANAVTSVDISHGFQFGLLEGGVFWGWPSSHTTVAFAMAAAFATLFPEERVAKWLAYAYAAYVAFSVSVSIHWLSEAVAGTIFGIVIGMAVGQSFRERSGRTESFPG